MHAGVVLSFVLTGPTTGRMFDVIRAAETAVDLPAHCHPNGGASTARTDGNHQALGFNRKVPISGGISVINHT